jgi:hypothetical protein
LSLSKLSKNSQVFAGVLQLQAALHAQQLQQQQLQHLQQQLNAGISIQQLQQLGQAQAQVTFPEKPSQRMA